MNSKELRKKFLDFFAKNNHPIIQSSSLIPYGDTTLLFTSAGMVQFKPYFLGLKTDLKRAASCQKCFRTTDIDNVGKTIRHLTFFEMLGNFSFGDYFKEESLRWGYEFLTKEIGIEPQKLWFSVYKGGIAPKDEEAISIWKKILPQNLHSHIFEMGEDNFWSMGDTGPSGPCSEIYYDRGEIYHKDCRGPWCGCDRYIEIWNHVFTQFDRQIDGSFKLLPKKNIDTGMGLERLCFIVENRFSPFETTLFYPLVKEYINKSLEYVNDNVKRYFELIMNNYSKEKDYYIKVIETDAYSIIPNLRIIQDHIRGASFLISEGVLPSNEGRGYILRRLIRRALRYSMLLGVKEPILYKLVDGIKEIYDGVYSQISENQKHIEAVIKYEEEGFLDTIENGEKYINELLKNGRISGEDAFRIYETYGYPYELIKEIALKNGIIINDNEFEKAKQKAQEVSRKWKGEEKDLTIFHKINSKFKKTEFLGYNSLKSVSKLTGIIDENGNELENAEKGEFWLVFDKTPFYAESGGQIGDSGLIYENGNVVGEVVDTQKPLGDVFYHKVVLKGRIEKEKEYELCVNEYRRKKISSNHTATHLINAALKFVFGPNTIQAGSLVNDEKFRFDYTITRTPSYDEIKKVEEIANNAILRGYKVYKGVKPLEEAKKMGATILIGERYEDPARCILINEKGFDDYSNKYSLELCGGTHVDDLKDVFRIKILKDSSIARGIRRIEGVSGYSLIEWYEKRSKICDELGLKLNCQDIEIMDRIEKIEKEIKELKSRLSNLNLGSKEDEVELKNGSKFVFVKIPAQDIKLIRNIADKKRNELKSAFIFLYSVEDEKLNFVLTKTRDNSLSVKEIFSKLETLGLKAGGRDDFIQGGGRVEDEKLFKEKIISLIL